jgi:hypothetical protein
MPVDTPDDYATTTIDDLVDTVEPAPFETPQDDATNQLVYVDRNEDGATTYDHADTDADGAMDAAYLAPEPQPADDDWGDLAL